MRKILLLILLGISLNSFAQIATGVNNLQAFPWRTFSNPNMVGLVYDGSQYRMYGFDKYALLDTTNATGKFGTKYDLSLKYPLTGNPSGFISTELDPTVPSYAKGLTAFSVIKSSTDLLYKPIGYTPDTTVYRTVANSLSLANAQTKFNTKFDIPTGTTSQYIRGDGSLSTFPTIPVSSVFGRTGSVTAQSGDYTTSQVTEGTNLYYTQPRFDNAFASKSTTNLTEGVNLYWTSTRFNTAFSSKTTTDLAEGTNQYFTNSRARSALSGGAGISYSNSTGIITLAKRIEPYSGTTNASGQFTVTFSTAYSVAPNIQANIINGTDTQNIRITAISTTGFTVLVRNRTDVVGLLPSWSNVSGASVDVLINEK